MAEGSRLIRVLIGGVLMFAALKFTTKDVAKVYIDPRYCKVLANGDLNCDRVRVVLGTLGVEEMK